MTKVEELRENLLYMVAGDLAMPSLVRIVDNLIATVEARGVEKGRAEGAAVGVSAARKQLRAASASITKQEGTRSIGGIRHYLIPVRAFSVPIASVLAPTKEKP